MAIPRKGSRRTEIGNHLYLWRVKKTKSPRPYGRSRGLYFVLLVQREVEHFTRPGSVATFLLESRSPWFKTMPWGGDKPGTNVSSTDVGELIEHALEHGWDPDDPEAPCFFVPPDDAPELAKFNLAAAA
jgi:hypothetical protein